MNLPNQIVVQLQDFQIGKLVFQPNMRYWLQIIVAQIQSVLKQGYSIVQYSGCLKSRCSINSLEGFKKFLIKNGLGLSKMSEIWTACNPDDNNVSEIGTSLDFRHTLYISDQFKCKCNFKSIPINNKYFISPIVLFFNRYHHLCDLKDFFMMVCVLILN